jgi:hypothetical protein
VTSYLVSYDLLVGGQLRASGDATITVAEPLPVDNRFGEAAAVLAEQIRRNPHPKIPFPPSSVFVHIRSVTEVPQ